MAAKLTSETRRLYSWWWDSHISPKNSKWLQENLTDLDSKVKAMIKIINEDADSFARRAEMYYKKRPELMKLVEEFYRAYRALAERYDHATGELRLAHRTMIEAFPNQVPFMLTDDPSSPVASHLEGIFDPDDSDKATGAGFSKSGEAVLRELKTAEGRLRGEDHSLDLRSMILNESAKVEAEMQRLKQALAKMEAERDAALAQYRDTLERLSAMEKELNSAQAEAEEVAKCASEARSEVDSLRESLKKVEIESLRQAEENAERLSEQKEQAESEIKAMKEEFSRLNKEKEDAFLRYQQCLEMISKLQSELMEAKDQQLQLEANDLVQEIAAKDQQLAAKNTELEELMSRLKEEQSQFTQVESVLHKLQDMHSQSQEDQRALALELREEIRSLRDDNRALNDLKQVKESLEVNVRRQTERNELLQQQLEGLYKKYPNLQDSNSSSLNDVKGELERSKEKMSALSGEKSALLSQLQIITESMQKLLEKNVLLENSLHGANIQLEGLRVKSRSLEEFCQYLKEEKSGLQTERCNLVYRLECVERKLEKLETRFTRLEDKYAGQVSGLEDRISSLREENRRGKNDTEEQLERAVSAQVEIFILRKFLKDMEEGNCSLMEAEKDSERLIEELESENMMQYLEIEYLVEKVDKLKSGICQLLEAVEIDLVTENDPEMLLPRARGSIKDMRRDLAESKDESQELLIQNNVLTTVIMELSLEKDAVDQEMCHLREAYSNVENETRVVRRKMAMKETENIELYVCNEELNQQFLVERERLSRKEEELLEAERRMKAIEDVNTELNTTIEGLKVQCNDLDDKIFELSKCREDQDMEIGLLREANASLENEVGVLCQEIEECRIIEVVLNSELHEIASEFELWEAEATSFYFDLQMCSMREALLENKVRELRGLCEDLEGSGARKSMEIESLKSRVTFLESEKEELKSKLDAYLPAISSLKDNFVSLEQSPALQTKLHWPATTNQPVAELMVQESRSRPSDARERRASMPDGLTELQDLQSRVKAIETSVEDRLQAEIKLEAATKEIKEPKSRNNHVLERKDGNLHSRSRNGSAHMKDIPLDYISDASPSSHRRRKSSRLSDQLLGLWEAPPPPPLRNPEIEKLEVPKQGGSRKAILERLASDAEKLASLQASVEELRRKAEINKRSAEYRRLQGQLREVESSMVQLVSVNTELTRTVKESAVVEAEQALRRKMSEQSRRDSERIGSLQLELQKIQSVMAKLEEEKNVVKKVGLSRIRTGFVLREFVYGRSRSRKQKKSRFCGCFRPSQKQV